MTHPHSKGNKSHTNKLVVLPLKTLLALAVVTTVIAMSSQAQVASAAPAGAAKATSSEVQAAISSNDPTAIKNSENVPEEPLEPDTDPNNIQQYKIRPVSLDLSESSAKKSQDKLEYNWEEEENTPGLELTSEK